jgi:predicted transcriptional regulator
MRQQLKTTLVLDRELHYCIHDVHSSGEYQMAESDKLSLIADITASYLRRNSVSIDQIGAVVSSVTNALNQAANGSTESTSTDGQQAPVAGPMSDNPKPKPAVSIKKSIEPEYIVCLEDGVHAITLKRHLKSAHGLTPQQYRERWRLPSDYPMSAPAYSERRSKMAKETGLGRKPGETKAVKSKTAKPKGRTRKAPMRRATRK